MATAFYDDLTLKLSQNKKVVVDIGGWDYAILQVVGTPAGLTVQGSLDSGATNSSEGNAGSATNFSTIQATNLSSGAAVTTLSAAGLYKVSGTRYVQIGDGSTGAATKLLVQYYKVH